MTKNDKSNPKMRRKRPKALCWSLKKAGTFKLLLHTKLFTLVYLEEYSDGAVVRVLAASGRMYIEGRWHGEGDGDGDFYGDGDGDGDGDDDVYGDSDGDGDRAGDGDGDGDSDNEKDGTFFTNFTWYRNEDSTNTSILSVHWCMVVYISMFLNTKIFSSVGWRDPQMITPEE